MNSILNLHGAVRLPPGLADSGASWGPPEPGSGLRFRDLSKAEIARIEHGLSLREARQSDLEREIRAGQARAADSASRLQADVLIKNAQQRADLATNTPRRKGARTAERATRDFAQFILDAREKLRRWTPGDGEPPITRDDVIEQKRLAARDGANPQVLDLTLEEPRNAFDADAERRLIASVLGPEGPRAA